jgi:Vacuolar protein sorting-associated protein 26
MFSFGSNPTSIYIKFNGGDSRVKKSIKINGVSRNEEMLLFLGQEAVSGTVEVVLPHGRAIDHLGIKIEMIGQIGEFFGDLGRKISP